MVVEIREYNTYNFCIWHFGLCVIVSKIDRCRSSDPPYEIAINPWWRGGRGLPSLIALFVYAYIIYKCINVGALVLSLLQNCINKSITCLLSPAAPKARDGRYCNAPRLSDCPSVCPSVTFSFRTVTQKRIAVFSRNFAGTCSRAPCHGGVLYSF